MANGKGKSENTDFIFLGSKITADSDCCHEIQRCSFLGRKGMTNLDSIFKSRDITLLTNVCIVKSVVFPVVIYRCETWAIKKAECQRIDDFKFWWVRRLLSPLDCQEINPEIIQPGIFIRRTDAEAEAPILWPPDVKSWLTGKDPDMGKIGGKRIRWQQNIRWFEQALGDSEGQGSLAWCISWGQKESDRTYRLNNNPYMLQNVSLLL